MNKKLEIIWFEGLQARANLLTTYQHYCNDTDSEEDEAMNYNPSSDGGC